MLHWADYLIFALFLLGSIVVGLYHAFTGGRQRTNEEFITGNHKLKLVPTTVSLVASYMSALTIIGVPAEIYSYGIMTWPGFFLSGFIGTMVVVFFVIPWVYPMKLVSVYEYFNRRYGNSVIQTYASVLGIVTAMLYTGTAILAPAIAMETATGLPANISIPVITVVCTLYTALGGIRAVIWTDVFQTVVMLGGIITIMVTAMVDVGGIRETFVQLHSANRTIFSFSPNPTVRHTWWNFVFGLSVSNISFMGFQQSSIQRFSSVNSISVAKRIPFFWWLGTVALATFSQLSGMAMVAHYARSQCDPIFSGRVTSCNQLLPLFVTDMFEGIHGFSGLFLATLYSATLSTVSSTLSGAAANAWADIVEPRLPNLSEHRAATVSKLLVLLFGTLSIGLSFLASTFEGPVLQITMSLMTSTSAPMLGLFVLGSFRCFKWVSWQGAFTGAVVGQAIDMWIIFGGMVMDELHPPLPPLSVAGCSTNTTVPPPTYRPATGLGRLYSVSYAWYIDIGCMSTIVAGCLASLVYKFILPRRYLRQPSVDESLFMNFRGVFTKRNPKKKEVGEKGEVRPMLAERSEGKVTSV